MATSSSRTRSRAPVLSRSNPPAGRFSSPGAGRYSSAFASSSASAFSSQSSTFFHSPNHHHHRSASPTRVNLVGSPNHSSTVRSHVLSRPIASPAVQRKTCLCAPTTHPGSFRCSLHKGFQVHPRQNHAVSSPSNRLNARRSAMTNSLVRIGTVEGELVKRALAALIRPSSHQQRRRAGFQPGPSRLSVMSKAGDADL